MYIGHGESDRSTSGWTGSDLEGQRSRSPKVKNEHYTQTSGFSKASWTRLTGWPWGSRSRSPKVKSPFRNDVKTASCQKVSGNLGFFSQTGSVTWSSRWMDTTLQVPCFMGHQFLAIFSKTWQDATANGLRIIFSRHMRPALGVGVLIWRLSVAQVKYS